MASILLVNLICYGKQIDIHGKLVSHVSGREMKGVRGTSSRMHMETPKLSQRDCHTKNEARIESINFTSSSEIRFGFFCCISNCLLSGKETEVPAINISW